MNKELAADTPNGLDKRLKWIGFILIASGLLSFSKNTFLGDIIALSGAVLILGSCIWVRWVKNKRG
jgi:hypothetical protein